MSNCQNLCTAEKCQELERRIAELENKLEQHLTQKIPEAHKWDGTFDIFLDVFNDDLNLELHIDNIDTKTASVKLPFVTDQEFQDHIRTNVNASSNLGHTYDPEIDHNLSIIQNGNNTITLTSDIFLEGKPVTDNAEIPLNEFDSNLKIDGTLTGKTLLLSIADGNSSDTAEIPLSFVLQEDFDKHLKLDIPEAHKYQKPSEDLQVSGNYQDDNLTITVKFGETQDTANILLDMNCDELKPLIENLEQVVKQENGDVKSRLNKLESSINNESFIDNIQDIERQVEVTGNTLGNRIGEIINVTNKIYSVLGGNIFWDDVNKRTLKIESELKTLGKQQYNDKGKENTITVNNFVDLIKAYVSVPYHRSGFHRLPATLIESIIKPNTGGDKTIEIYDNLSFQEWFFRQFDAISGQYPIEFDYKIIDDKGKEVTETISIPNTAEAIVQILGLVLGVSEETDKTLNAVMRCLTETRSSANAALLAHDFARANAEYLGYRGRERKKEIDVSFTPGAKSLVEALKPSKQNIIGWDFDDKETLVEIIKKILFSSEIIKAAMYLPFDPNENRVTGDSIKDTLDTNQQLQDERWEKFKTQINNPTGRYKVDNKPKTELKDITVDKEN